MRLAGRDEIEKERCEPVARFACPHCCPPGPVAKTFAIVSPHSRASVLRVWLGAAAATARSGSMDDFNVNGSGHARANHPPVRVE